MQTPLNPTQRANSRRVWVLNTRRAGLLGWLFRYYTFAALALIPIVLTIGLQSYRYFAAKVPNMATVDAYGQAAPGVTQIYSGDGALLAELAREHRRYTKIQDMPRGLVLAFLAAEDRRFTEHTGLDMRGLARAMVANFRHGTVVQGGSTITQQVAKSFLADQKRTIERKIVEAILAIRLESRLGKRKILEYYLNKIFLGNGAYGVAAAASRYFGKQLDELSLAESALIAGLARAPSRYSPTANPKLAQHRRSVVLQTMVDAGFITDEQRDTANDEAIVIVHRDDPFRVRAPHFTEEVRKIVTERLGEDTVLHAGLRIETKLHLGLQSHARDSVDMALRRLDRRQGWRGPVAHIETADAREEFARRLDRAYAPASTANTDHSLVLGVVTDVRRDSADIQLGRGTTGHLPLRNAEWAAPYDRFSGENEQTATRLDRVLEVGDVVWVRRVRTPRTQAEPNLRLAQTPRVEGALFTFDHETGYVDAMVGGLDYDRSQFNRTTQACRQPGSVFKAIYYGLALDTPEWRMDSILNANAWKPEDGEEWNPRNIDKTIDGKVLLRTALIKSLNTPSVRLFVKLGAEAVVEWSRRLGITTPLIADKGLSLGASCVHIDEISRAFGIYVRGGTRVDPVLVTRITDKNGRVLLDQRHPRDPTLGVGALIDRVMTHTVAPAPQLIDPKTAFLITRLMREVVTAGIGARAGGIGAPAGGKSGSASGRFKRAGGVQDLTTDTWFVGFTSQRLTAAWLGFDNVQERSMGDKEASYTTATPMWTDFMKYAVETSAREHGPLPMHKPTGLTKKVVDATKGGPPRPGFPEATIYLR